MEKEQIVSWLKDGKEFKAAHILESCVFELAYEDTGFSLSGGQDTDIFSLKILCPRIILDNLEEHKIGSFSN